MPLINVHMAQGRTPEQKKALMNAMTDAMVEHLGAPREAVRVWINEFPNTDFMAGGEVLAEKQARVAAEAAGRRSSSEGGSHPVPGQ